MRTEMKIIITIWTITLLYLILTTSECNELNMKTQHETKWKITHDRELIGELVGIGILQMEHEIIITLNNSTDWRTNLSTCCDWMG